MHSFIIMSILVTPNNFLRVSKSATSISASHLFVSSPSPKRVSLSSDKTRCSPSVSNDPLHSTPPTPPCLHSLRHFFCAPSRYLNVIFTTSTPPNVTVVSFCFPFARIFWRVFIPLLSRFLLTCSSLELFHSMKSYCCLLIATSLPSLASKSLSHIFKIGVPQASCVAQSGCWFHCPLSLISAYLNRTGLELKLKIISRLPQCQLH